jgi:ketosteroid isomerase-like protein
VIDTPDRVVGLYHHRDRIKGSGDRVEHELGAVFYFRDGKIVRALTYLSWREALETARLE